MACRAGCPTQNHATWGECAREAHIATVAIAPYADRTASKAFDKELATYREARDLGLQPESTKLAESRRVLNRFESRPSTVNDREYAAAQTASVGLEP